MKGRAFHIKARFVVLTLLLGVGATAALWFANRDPLFASPTAERRDVEVLFARTWAQYTSEKPPKTPRLPVPPLKACDLRRTQTGVWVTPTRSPIVDDQIPTPVTALQASEAGVAELPGGGQLRLEGFALFVPGSEAARESKALQFLRPDTQEPLSDADLNAMGIPDGVRELPENSLRTFPLLRVIMRSEGLLFNRVGRCYAFDGRSRAMVAHGLDIYGLDQVVILDVELSLWHDTSLVLSVEIPCGEVMRKPLTIGSDPIELISEVYFECVALEPGFVSNVKKQSGEYFLEISPENDLGSVCIHRMFPSAWAEHAALEVRSEGSEEPQRYLPDSLELSWHNLEENPGDISELTLAFYPEKARAFFEISALPQMPNSRKVRNLFDVEIPEVWVSEEDFYGADSMLPYLLIDVVAEATQTSLDPMSASPMVQAPTEKGMLYRDVTPRELVGEYQAYVVDPYLRVRQSDHTLVFHRPDPWDVRLKQWWYMNAPDWLK